PGPDSLRPAAFYRVLGPVYLREDGAYPQRWRVSGVAAGANHQRWREIRGQEETNPQPGGLIGVDVGARRIRGIVYG
ncbi:hypothetical protein ELP18_29750, partial [Klebsiella pneumoniae]|nr:hypothetical protein [Klebsiella pneumoniae]